MFLVSLKKFIPRPIRNLRHFFYAWYGAVKYHYPSEEMFVIGVTGTTGKSSIIYFLRQVLESAGLKVGSLSTVDFYVAGETKMNDQKMTMLGKMQIQMYLREMADKGCQIAIIETTSEGYLQYRHRFINFDTIILTDLYPEHVEAHGGFENYKKAKLNIFDYVSKSRRKNAHGKLIEKMAVVNANNQYAGEFLLFAFEKKIIFGREDKKNFIADLQIQLDINVISSKHIVNGNGLHFFVGGTDFDAPLFGEYNIVNLLAVIALARGLDVSWSIIQKSINNIKPSPGRIEFISEAEKFGFKVVVDYAFEPNALVGLYQAIDLLPHKRIIHVCGSTGGGRDVGRREPIGKLVGEKADVVIATDEDPYGENPIKIIKQVSMGAQTVGKILDKNLFEILDRREAIGRAVTLAQKGDIVLITGKGCEQAMCVSDNTKIPWDDRQVVREALQLL